MVSNDDANDSVDGDKLNSFNLSLMMMMVDENQLFVQEFSSPKN